MCPGARRQLARVARRRLMATAASMRWVVGGIVWSPRKARAQGLTGASACAGHGRGPSAADAHWNVLDEKIKSFIDLSYNDKAGGDLSTAVQHWVRFCGVMAQDGMWARPLAADASREEALAEEFLVMQYACFIVEERGCAPATAAKYVSTVQGWHARRFGCKLAGGMRMWRLQALLKGMEVAQGGKRPKRKRLGVKPRQLAAGMARCLGGSSALEANWRAALETGFCGLLRGAELGMATGESWSPATGMTREDVSFRWRGGREEAVLKVRPRKKGARTVQGKSLEVLLIGGGRFLNPVRALRRLFAEDPVPRDQWATTPLFRDECGIAFTTAKVRGVVKWLVDMEGGDSRLYGAHSLRIGGATAALAAGVPALVIKAMGRWGSDIYEVYTQLSDAAARSFGSKVANVDYDYVEGAYYSEEL